MSEPTLHELRVEALRLHPHETITTFLGRVLNVVGGGVQVKAFDVSEYGAIGEAHITLRLKWNPKEERVSTTTPREEK